jgi:hypothetical protein
MAGPCCAPSSGRSAEGPPRPAIAASGAVAPNLVRLDGGVFQREAIGNTLRATFPKGVMMMGQSRVERIKVNAANIAELALQLGQDKKFRQRLVSAIEHGTQAGLRTKQSLGVLGAVTRLASDQALLKELQSARRDLEEARERLDKKRRSHKARNLIVLASLASLAAIPQLRSRLITAIRSALRRLQLPSPRIGHDDSTGNSQLEDMTRDELYSRAQDADVPGRSEMSKDQLVEALRSRS